MMNYQAKLEAYLTHYQPELRAEFQQTQTLQSYLEEQVTLMEQMEAKIISQLQERTPGLSQLQAEMEAQRTVLDLYLTP